MHNAFLYIFLLSLHNYDMKMPIFTICQGWEHKTTTFLFFSWILIQAFRIQLQIKEFVNIWRIKGDGKSGIKSEAVEIHFLSDVL